MGILKLMEMKNIIKYITITFAACSLFAGCQKDEGPVDPYSVNWVYLEQPAVNSFYVAFKPDGIWVNEFSQLEKLKRVRCTKPAEKDLYVSLAIDESFVEKYNAAHGTNYMFLPAAKLETESIVIKKGEYVSADTIKISYPKASEIIAAGSAEYILPVAVRQAEGSLEISEQGVTYLFYTAEEISANMKVTPSGTPVESTGWTIKDASGKDYTSTFANSTKGVEFEPGTVLTVDFGEVVNLKSFGMEYSSDYYSAKNLTVYLSADGTEYTSIGTYELVKRDKHNLELITARQTRSVRLRINETQGTRNITIKNFTATEE